jgi:hypothetical protein
MNKVKKEAFLKATNELLPTLNGDEAMLVILGNEAGEQDAIKGKAENVGLIVLGVMAKNKSFRELMFRMVDSYRIALAEREAEDASLRNVPGLEKVKLPF